VRRLEKPAFAVLRKLSQRSEVRAYAPVRARSLRTLAAHALRTLAAHALRMLSPARRCVSVTWDLTCRFAFCLRSTSSLKRRFLMLSLVAT
jgi:hypothetical protein